ncbi:MAG: hypothetical protein ABIN67_10150, partial [Ferruginibacter sp.]
MKAYLFKTYVAILLLFAAGCAKEYSYEYKPANTLKDAQATCLPSVINGSFFKNTNLNNDTAYIELQVNVAVTGSYFINTDLQNGFQFAGSGTFNATGLQTVRLKPTGNPVDTGYTDFTVCYDTSCCPVSVYVSEAPANELPDNAWQYTDASNGKTYTGSFNATYYSTTPVSTLVSLRQQSITAADTSFEISFVFPPTGIKTGSFTTDQDNAWSYSHNGVCVNCAWEVAYKLYGAITNIVVTDYDSLTKTIKGTFIGTTISGGNEVVPIKDGKFKAV